MAKEALVALQLADSGSSKVWMGHGKLKQVNQPYDNDWMDDYKCALEFETLDNCQIEFAAASASSNTETSLALFMMQKVIERFPTNIALSNTYAMVRQTKNVGFVMIYHDDCSYCLILELLKRP